MRTSRFHPLLDSGNFPSAGPPLSSRPLPEKGLHDADARWREALHHRLHSEGHARRKFRSCSFALRTRSRPTGSRRLPVACSVRRRSSIATDTSSRFRTRAENSAQKGTFRVMNPYKPEKKSPNDIDESSDNYDTIEWLLENLPAPQRTRRAVGYLVPGMADRHGHDRRAPRAQGFVPSVVSVGHVHRRRLPPQRRVPLPVHVQLAVRQCATARRDADDRTSPATFDYGTPQTVTTSFSIVGHGRKNQRALLPRTGACLERIPGSPELRLVLAGPECPEGPEETSPPRCSTSPGGSMPEDFYGPDQHLLHDGDARTRITRAPWSSARGTMAAGARWMVNPSATSVSGPRLRSTIRRRCCSPSSVTT